MSGEKIAKKRVVKYVGHIKEKVRLHRHHSNFYIGMYSYAWVELCNFLLLKLHN